MSKYRPVKLSLYRRACRTSLSTPVKAGSVRQTFISARGSRRSGWKPSFTMITSLEVPRSPVEVQRFPERLLQSGQAPESASDCTIFRYYGSPTQPPGFSRQVKVRFLNICKGLHQMLVLSLRCCSVRCRENQAKAEQDDRCSALLHGLVNASRGGKGTGHSRGAGIGEE